MLLVIEPTHNTSSWSRSSAAIQNTLSCSCSAVPHSSKENKAIFLYPAETDPRNVPTQIRPCPSSHSPAISSGWVSSDTANHLWCLALPLVHLACIPTTPDLPLAIHHHRRDDFPRLDRMDSGPLPCRPCLPSCQSIPDPSWIFAQAANLAVGQAVGFDVATDTSRVTKNQSAAPKPDPDIALAILVCQPRTRKVNIRQRSRKRDATPARRVPPRLGGISQSQPLSSVLHVPRPVILHHSFVAPMAYVNECETVGPVDRSGRSRPRYLCNGRLIHRWPERILGEFPRPLELPGRRYPYTAHPS